MTRDTDFFTKMDPWAQLQTRTQKVRTRTMQGAGKVPKWNQAFDLDVKDANDDITLTVWDEDNCSHDKVSDSWLSVPIPLCWCLPNISFIC